MSGVETADSWRMYATRAATSQTNDGRALEEAIGAHFRTHGYEVELNVVVDTLSRALTADITHARPWLA
jgi:hypothetical protein